MVKAGDKSRKEKLSNYQIIYVLGLFIAFMALGTGLVLTDKKKGN